MNTTYTAKDYLESANKSLKYWKGQLEKLNNNQNETIELEIILELLQAH